jgi:hypothetical protein
VCPSRENPDLPSRYRFATASCLRFAAATPLRPSWPPAAPQCREMNGAEPLGTDFWGGGPSPSDRQSAGVAGLRLRAVPRGFATPCVGGVCGNSRDGLWGGAVSGTWFRGCCIGVVRGLQRWRTGGHAAVPGAHRVTDGNDRRNHVRTVATHSLPAPRSDGAGSLSRDRVPVRKVPPRSPSVVATRGARTARARSAKRA